MVAPVQTKGVQADSPHMANDDRSLAVENTKLWQVALARHHYFWPDPRYAPVALLTTYATWTDAMLAGPGGVTFPWQVPWHRTYTDHAARLRARVLFGVSGNVPVQLRLKGRDIDEPIDDGDGVPGLSTAQLPPRNIQSGAWQAQSAELGVTQLYHAVLDAKPAVEFGRMVAVGIQAAVALDYWPWTTSPEFRAYLYSVTIEEYL